jgi:hypothetical protein
VVASIGTSMPLHCTEASIINSIKQHMATSVNTKQTIASKTSIVSLKVSTDDTAPFEAAAPQHRVFTTTQQTDSASTAKKILLHMHVPTAAVELIKTHYVTPMQQRVVLLKQALKQQKHMPFAAMPAKRMQEIAYLSPVFIPIDVNNDDNQSTKQALTGGTYSNSSGSTSSTIVDESQYPHIVFYIVPYSTAPAASIANDALCGNRADDQLTFVIRLPQGLALHPGAAEVSHLVTKWLSELAGVKLDMFLVPDNW